jgi:hypothetical protein
MNIQTIRPAIKLGLDKTSALDIPAYEPEEIDFWFNDTILKFTKTRYSGVNVKKQSFEETQKRIDDLSSLVKTAEPMDLILDIVKNIGTNSYVVDTTNVPWPTDYLFAIAEEVRPDEVDGINVASGRWGVTQCTHDRYRQHLDNPYSEHILHYGSAKPLRLFDDSNVRIVTDGNYTVDEYYLTYLKTPQIVDTINDVPSSAVANAGIRPGILYEVYGTNDTDSVTYDGTVYYNGDKFTGVITTSEYTETTASITSVYKTIDLPEQTHEEIVKMTVNTMLENIEQPRFKSHSVEVATME